MKRKLLALLLLAALLAALPQVAPVPLARAVAEAQDEGEEKCAPAVPAIKSTASGKKGVITVKVKKLKHVGGYEAQAALDPEFTTGLKSAKTKGAAKTKLSIKGLKSGRVYYVRVRSWQKKDGVKTTSDWSEAITQRAYIYHKTSVYGRMPGSHRNKVSKQIDRFIRDNIQAGMTDMEIADAIVEYIVVHARADCDYNMPYRHYENTAWAVFNYDHAACSGFCRITKAMFDSVGISCKHVNASKWTHQWCEVKIDGVRYKLDTQLLRYQYLYYNML